MNRALAFASLLAIAVSTLHAQSTSVPGLVSYQGRVTDSAGEPIGKTAPVNRTVIFRIWDSPSSTSPANRLYSEQQNVTVSGGEFSVLVGAGTPVSGETGNPFSVMSAAIFNGQARFLGVTVDDGDGNLGNDVEASPPQQIVTTPFAFRAQVAEAVATGGVAANSLANDAVGSAALATGAVTGTKLAAAAVGTTALADGSVTSGKLASGAVTTTALADGSVTGAKLAAGGIDATKLADGTVAQAKLAANSVDSSKIADGAIATADLSNSAVDTAKLADSAVTAAKLGTAAVETAKLADGAVSLAKHAANSVDSSKIVDGSIALADLTTTVREGLPKQRHIYNQAVFTDYVTARTKGRTLVAIDLGDLGNDVDGCVLHYYGWHRVSGPTQSRIGEIRFNLQQPGFVTDPNYPNIVWAIAAHHAMNATGNGSHAWGTANFRVNPQSLAGGAVTFHSVDDWVSFYNFYPGTLRPGETAPFNQNQEPNASNANAGGHPVTFNVTSVVTGANKLTITVDNPHAIQVGDILAISGMTGNPSANSTSHVVTAQPDRYTFEVALTGAAGTYSGGTVTHQPKYNKFRIWAAVHPDVSVRFIVSDR
jgi:hypothetical protein